MPTALRAPRPDDPNSLITSGYIRRDLGGISVMTFWRLEHHSDPAVRLPPPDLILGSNKLKLRKLGNYRNWKERVIALGRIPLGRLLKHPDGLPFGRKATSMPVSVKAKTKKRVTRRT